MAKSSLTDSQKLDLLIEKFDGLENRFDGLENRFDGLENRFDGSEKRFDGLENKFDRLEKKVNANHKFLQANAKRTAEIDRKVDENKKEIIRVHTRIDTLGYQLAEVDDDAPSGEDFRELESRVTKLEAGL